MPGHLGLFFPVPCGFESLEEFSKSELCPMGTKIAPALDQDSNTVSTIIQAPFQTLLRGTPLRRSESNLDAYTLHNKYFILISY